MEKLADCSRAIFVGQQHLPTKISCLYLVLVVVVVVVVIVAVAAVVVVVASASSATNGALQICVGWLVGWLAGWLADWLISIENIRRVL